MADLEVASAKGVYRKMDMIKAVNLKKYYTSDTYESACFRWCVVDCGGW